MARDGMADILTELRSRTDTTPNSYTVGGASYWSDDQLQDIADRYRRDYLDVPLSEASKMLDGVTVWVDYYIPRDLGPFMETADTSDAFSVVDSLGADAPSYTLNLLAGTVTFDSDTGGINYYLRCRTYDLDAAAAEVWGKKAAHRAELIDWKAGSHTLYEDQEYQHCKEMQQYYSSLGGIRSVRLHRDDYHIRGGYYG